MEVWQCKPDVTRTRSRWTSHTGAVLRRWPLGGIDGCNLALGFTSRPTSLATLLFRPFLIFLTTDQSHKSTAWICERESSNGRSTWPYWARQFSSSKQMSVLRKLQSISCIQKYENEEVQNKHHIVSKSPKSFFFPCLPIPFSPYELQHRGIP